MALYFLLDLKSHALSSKGFESRYTAADEAKKLSAAAPMNLAVCEILEIVTSKSVIETDRNSYPGSEDVADLFEVENPVPAVAAPAAAPDVVQAADVVSPPPTGAADVDF